MRFDFHVYHHVVDVDAALRHRQVLEAISNLGQANMALSAKLQATINDVLGRVDQVDTELDAIGVALDNSASVAAAATAAALAQAGVAEDTAAGLVETAFNTVKEHTDAVFAKVGVTPPSTTGTGGDTNTQGGDPPAALVFDGGELPDAVTGVGYSANLEASGGTGEITFAADPTDTQNGFDISATGSVHGAGAADGVSTWRVTATDSGTPPQSVSAGVTLRSATPAAQPEPLVLATSLPDATVGQGYTGALGIQGGTGPYIVTSSPQSDNGITVNSDGSVAGMPTSALVSTFNISVEDSSTPPLQTAGMVTLNTVAASA